MTIQNWFRSTCLPLLAVVLSTLGWVFLIDVLDTRLFFVFFAKKTEIPTLILAVGAYLAFVRWGRKMPWNRIFLIEMLASVPLFFTPVVSILCPNCQPITPALIVGGLLGLSFIIRIIALQMIGSSYRLHNLTMLLAVVATIVAADLYAGSSNLAHYGLVRNATRDYRPDRTLFWAPIDLATKIFKGNRDIDDRPFTIYFFGGSATRGDGLDDRSLAFPNIIDDWIHDRMPEANVQTFNMGVGGYTTFQIRLLLEQYIDQIPADLIVLYITYNDVKKLYGPYTQKEVHEMQAGRLGATHTVISHIQQVFARSHVYNYFVLLANKSKALLREVNIDFTVRPVPIPDMIENLTLILDQTRQHGIDLVLCAEAVNLENATECIETHEAIRKFASQNNVPFLDVHQSIQGTPNAPSLFIDLVHLNENGHQLVADLIAEYLVQQNLIEIRVKRATGAVLPASH